MKIVTIVGARPQFVKAARYFRLHDKATALIVSGWVEPVERHPGLQVLWSGTFGTSQRAPVANRSWDALAYDMLRPSATQERGSIFTGRSRLLDRPPRISRRWRRH